MEPVADSEPSGGLPAVTVRDFDAAQLFLDRARKAHAAGDDVQCEAACRLVMLALTLAPNGKIHTAHLRDEVSR